MSSKKVLIIGSGIAGIALSIRLVRMGYIVHVYESAKIPGGKINEYAWDNFRFDTGPSLFTMPELVDELFTICNKNPRHYFQYKQLDIVTKYFYHNGIVLNSYSDENKFAQEVTDKLGVKQSVIKKYLQIQKKSFHLLAPIFLHNPIHIFQRLFKIKNLPALWHIFNPRFLLSMNKANFGYFKNYELTQIFNRYGTYNGSNPYQMPSLFNIISHLEHTAGAFIAEKGMYQITQSLYQLAKDEGVQFYFNSYISAINVDKNCAQSIQVNDETITADLIISNMDVNNTYKKLLAPKYTPTHYLNNEKSTSALIFHWAIKGNFPNLDVHNILFAKNYEAEFDHLFNLKKIYIDPTIYIYISSKAVENDAPNDGENWFVMINTPHLESRTDWHKEIPKIRDIITAKIIKYLSFDIQQNILHEHVITPLDLQNSTHAYLGSLYGASSNSMLSAFFRHPNFSKIKGLYFCGGTVHPGGGIPLCLLSAKITAGLIQENYNH